MKLIDKDRVVAEIERRKNQFVSQAESFHKIGKEDKESYYAALASNMNSLSCFLDTLEVKEVNLEKENLTWKDIRELYIIFAEIDAEIEFCKTDIQGETIGYYREALKRFKSIKGE